MCQTRSISIHWVLCFLTADPLASCPEGAAADGYSRFCLRHPSPGAASKYLLCGCMLAGITAALSRTHQKTGRSFHTHVHGWPNTRGRSKPGWIILEVHCGAPSPLEMLSAIAGLGGCINMSPLAPPQAAPKGSHFCIFQPSRSLFPFCCANAQSTATKNDSLCRIHPPLCTR
jgi:hypothetical protein